MALNIAEMRRKAEEGSCPSQCMLGLCYLYGIDVETNYEEAFRFLSAAAEQRSSRAVLNLGRMYAQGLGVPQNAPEAIRHFEAVAKPSDSSDAFPARIELGRIFSHGLGVPIDTNMALKWYSSAIEIATDTNDPEEKEEARKYLDSANNSQ
jgi:TPR repeat protein